jgi:two-component system, sporulation sensor kinase E
LRMQDTGIGIPPEHLRRIFDPFFTTNKNGTGLGLSIVHQIVEKHSGTIQVMSEVNRGTTFTIIFGLMPEKE